MPWTKTKTYALITIAALSLAACSSLNIQAPTGVDRGTHNGAGADGGGGQG